MTFRMNTFALLRTLGLAALLAFTAVAAALPLLRHRQPDRPRPFRVPMIWLTAPAAVVVNLVLMSNLLPTVAVELATVAAIACFLWLFVRKGVTL